jgi:broad specificity phosphatase PhoE
LYSSPLERARQTAAPLADLTGLPVVIEPRLIESSNVFEGGRVELGAGLARRPDLWRHLGNPFRPSWGEAYTAIAERVLAAVAMARDSWPGGEVVMVSHQLPIWTARRAAEGRRLWHRPDRRQCGLASVTSLVFDGSMLVRVDYCEPAGPAAVGAGSAGA